MMRVYAYNLNCRDIVNEDHDLDGNFCGFDA